MNANGPMRGRAMRTVHELPEELLSIWNSIMITSGNLAALYSRRDNGFSFLRVPPVTSRKSIGRSGVTPPPPLEVKVFALYPPENTLAVAKENEK